MRKMMFEDFKGEKTFIGYSNQIQIRWLDNKYYGGPKKDGKYLVRFKDGKFAVLHGYGGNKNGLDLVILHIEDGVSIKHEDKTEFSSDEILKLGSSYNIWFEEVSGEYQLEEIIIYDINPPEYFMIPAFNEEGFAKTFDDVEGEDCYKIKNKLDKYDNFGYELKSKEGDI